MNPIPIAFIGGSQLSAVGNTHRIASEMDNRFELVAGCFSRNPDVNQSTASNWGLSTDQAYQNWKSLLDSVDTNSTVIALLTPTPHHFEVLEAAISMGFRIICEKSVTSSLDEIRSLSAQIDKSRSSLHAVYNYTGYPMIRELREIVQSGILGKLLHCEVEMPQEGFLRRKADGTEIQPQEWRRYDDFIPTVSLDLGIHVVNLFRFVTGERIEKVVGHYQSRGNVPDVVDNVSALAECSNDLTADFRFGKTSLGKSNGLSVNIYGSEGSASWIQIDPEYLRLSDCFGTTKKLHRGSVSCMLAHLDRYNRFKAGHPSGFLEAFSNHYFDIADELEGLVKASEFTFSANDAMTDMAVLHALSESVQSKKWTVVTNDKK